MHRLLTTLLDAEEYPAEELLILYHERWEEELAIDEVKTQLEEKVVLRSKAPAGVIQEIEGLMLRKCRRTDKKSSEACCTSARLCIW